MNSVPRTRTRVEVRIVVLLLILSSVACDAKLPWFEFLSASEKSSSKKPVNDANSNDSFDSSASVDQLVEQELAAAQAIGRPQPRVGMAYIPAGALVVGTSVGQLPRRPDRELAGEQVMLEGFFIDRFAYPNEEGGIPTTNVSQKEAERLCERQEKRLCSELEGERACKGPEKHAYEYGDTDDALVCKTGSKAHLRPSGYHVACQSDYGIHDLHGGSFEWTSSNYARGLSDNQRVIRGGDSPEGAVVGRCANLEARSAEERDGSLGFRCCAGSENKEKVELEMTSRPSLLPRAKFNVDLEKALLLALPDDVRKTLRAAGPISRQRVWFWHPVANEELLLSALCGRGMPRPIGPRCGLLVAAKEDGKVRALAWISSGRWVAQLHQRRGVHDLWLVGGDERGGLKRPMTYFYGDVLIGEQSRGRTGKK